MSAPWNTLRLPYLMRHSRSGRIYFLTAAGAPVPIQGDYGSPEFMAQHAKLVDARQRNRPQSNLAQRSIQSEPPKEKKTVTKKSLAPADLPYWPRLMSRKLAAAYLDIAPGTFDAEVKAGFWPQPIARPFGSLRKTRLFWDRLALDRCVDDFGNSVEASIPPFRRSRPIETARALPQHLTSDRAELDHCTPARLVAVEPKPNPAPKPKPPLLRAIPTGGRRPSDADVEAAFDIWCHNDEHVLGGRARTLTLKRREGLALCLYQCGGLEGWKTVLGPPLKGAFRYGRPTLDQVLDPMNFRDLLLHQNLDKED